MAGVEFFERELRLAIGDLRPEVMQKNLALFARQSLAEVQANGQAPQTYDRYVNGRLGAAEESVRLPGPILYVFSNWNLVIEAALVELKKRVPQKSGRYAGSFLVVVGGKVVTSYASIPADAEVVIVNSRPYTRRLEVGKSSTGRKHFERAKTALNSRFRGAFSATTMFLKVSGGLHPEMPYILRGSSGKRKDSQAGQPITYPALVLQAA